MPRSSKWTPARTAIVTALTVAACLGTLFIRIPIPATTGYFNVGDIFVILAGLWLGPIAGLIIGAVGPGAADAIGYPQFILATVVTKGLEGFVVGLIGHRVRTDWLRVLAATIGGAVIIVGYFVFEAFVYPALGKSIPFFDVTTFQAAVVEIGPNTLQALVAIIVGVGLFKAINAGRPDSDDRVVSPDRSSSSSP